MLTCALRNDWVNAVDPSGGSTGGPSGGGDPFGAAFRTILNSIHLINQMRALSSGPRIDWKLRFDVGVTRPVGPKGSKLYSKSGEHAFTLEYKSNQTHTWTKSLDEPSKQIPVSFQNMGDNTSSLGVAASPKSTPNNFVYDFAVGWQKNGSGSIVLGGGGVFYFEYGISEGSESLLENFEIIVKNKGEIDGQGGNLEIEIVDKQGRIKTVQLKECTNEERIKNGGYHYSGELDIPLGYGRRPIKVTIKVKKEYVKTSK